MSMHILGLARGEGGTEFELAGLRGGAGVSGALGGTAPTADELVIADYSLLERRDLQRYTYESRVWLLPPGFRGDAASVASRHAELPADKRVSLPLSEIGRLRPLLEKRAMLAGQLRQLREQIRSLLQAAAPEYLEILSENGELIAEALPLLRDYPTPQQLNSAALVQLTHALQEAFPAGRQQAIDRVLAFSQSAPRETADPETLWSAREVIPLSIDMLHLAEEQQRAIDASIYEAAQQGNRPAKPTEPPPASTALLGEAPNPGAGALDPAQLGHLACLTRGELLERVESLMRRRVSRERAPSSDFAEFQQVARSLEAARPPLDEERRLRLNLVGQLLALSAGEYLQAIRFRTACESSPLAKAHLWGRRARPLQLPRAQRPVADLAIAAALTELCAVDAVAGVEALRSIAEGGLVLYATPELVSEALGMLALLLTVFGMHHDHPRAITAMRRSVAKHRSAGPARAAADLAELFIGIGRPQTDAETSARLRAAADEHTRDTVYRQFYYGVLQHVAAVEGDPDEGLAAHDALEHEVLWPGHRGRLMQLAKLSNVLHLAAKGSLAAARQELTSVELPDDDVAGGVDRMIRDITELRLDYAVGNAQKVLRATRPGARLDADTLEAQGFRRYVPVSLVIAGSVLRQQGDAERAEEAFMRATRLSVRLDEWYAVICSETPEYREWLESLDPSRLPGGLAAEVRDGLLRRPIFIRHALPSVTPQQTQILRMLAQGRSTASIAAELHITANTMKSHLQRMYKRIGVNSREQAVLLAEAYGLF